MAQHHTPVPVDPEQVRQAQALWDKFIAISKWSIVVVAVVLTGLTIAFVG